MKNKGFTLIEILVVISIIVITTGAIIINNNSSKEAINLFSATGLLKENLSSAKEKAMSGVGASIDSHYGVGVWFGDSEGKYYYVYRNNNEEKGYNEGDTILEKVVLEKGIKYEVIGYNSVLFVPPTPIIYKNNDILTDDIIIKVYKEADGTKFNLVKVNSVGLIE